MGRLHAQVHHLKEAIGRLLLAGAIVLAATTITLTADWWVTGPGTHFPVNGYRFPLIGFNEAMNFRDENNSFALISGWRAPEADATWAEQHQATIAFRIPDGPPLSATSALQLSIEAYLVPPKLPAQHISVWEGETKLGEAVVTTTPASIVIPLKGISLPRNPAPVMLRFEMPDATAPHDLLGSGYDHPQSIGLVSLEVRP
jgi:hypothetical protein